MTIFKRTLSRKSVEKMISEVDIPIMTTKKQ